MLHINFYLFFYETSCFLLHLSLLLDAFATSKGAK